MINATREFFRLEHWIGWDMKAKYGSTKILVILGTVMVWLPVLATVVTSIIGSIRERQFLFDFLMPMELFVLVFLGGILLFWAALRVRRFRNWIGWSLAAAVALLLGTQAYAVATGLAHGETEPVGWVWTGALALTAGYMVAVLLLCAFGISLLVSIFRSSEAGN